jgi:hypothetical protein
MVENPAIKRRREKMAAGRKKRRRRSSFDWNGLVQALVQLIVAILASGLFINM